MQAAPAVARQKDGPVLSLVAAGHFLSHFYMMLLPPLFVLLKVEYGVSYLALGLLMTLYNGVAGAAQIPVGFLVDRVGARPVLVGGLALLAAGMGLVGFSPSYGVTVALVVAAGAGHSVFHPANYAILSAAITPAYMGRAFSIHTFAGHLGSAAGPASVGLLTALWGWRTGLVALGALGLLVTLALLANWNLLRDPIAERKLERKLEREKPAAGEPDAPGQTDWALLLSRPMVLFFLFFAAGSLTSGAVQSFSIAALIDLRGFALPQASTALTFYLATSAAGILLGGVIADLTQRHNLVAGTAFLVSGLCLAVIGAFLLPLAAVYLAMAMAGLCQGLVRPARDMMVRAAAPKGSTGKVFGFVSTGIMLGGAIAPVLYGWVVDLGSPEWVFYLAAIVTVGGALTVAAHRQKPAA
ncbi:MAG: MFS transporter [bacterium]